MTYQPGQFENVVPFVKKVPKWLVLGGPADGDEAQCAVRRWPGLRVIGVEPSAAMRDCQYRGGWPSPGLLLPWALSDRLGVAQMHSPPDQRCCSLMPDRKGEEVSVKTVTIDHLDRAFGPFRDAILWLDIEGYELESLRGAEALFARNAVLLANVEIIERRAEATAGIEAFFAEHGFVLACRWNQQGSSHHDRVYVPRG